MFGKYAAATATLLVIAGSSYAQPGHPQGTGRIGGSGGYSGSSGGYVSSPTYSGATNPTGSGANYQSLFPPEPERSGWQARSDGWYYYWSQNELLGAYDADSGFWYAYQQPAGWGKASTPPWKRR
jgi:hypothetical protein